MLQINDNIRIVKTDKHCIQIEEFRPVVDPKTKMSRNEWCWVGYYGDLKSAIRGVIRHYGKELTEQDLKGWKSVVDKLEEIEAKMAELVKEEL